MAYLRDRRAFGNIGTRKFRGARFGDPLSPRGPQYTLEGRVLDYSTDVGPFTIVDQSGESNTATLYSGRGLTMDAVNDTVTYATGYSSASRTATLWGKFNTTSPVALLGSVSGSFIFTPTATGVWEELTSTATVEGDLAWDLGLDFDIGDLVIGTEHWTHNDWSDPTGDTSNGKTIVDSGPNDYHGTCIGCSGFTGEATIPQTADKNWNKYQWFNGTNAYVETTGMTAAADYFGACTISSWIFVEDTASTQVVWTLGSANYRLIMLAGNWGISGVNDIGVAVTAGWQKVAVDFNSSGAGVSFSINEVEVWTGDTGVSPASTNTFSLGARESTGYGLFFKGSISGFAITGSSVKNFAYTGLGNDPWKDTIGSNNGTEAGTFTRELVTASDANDQIDALGTAISEPRLNTQQLNLFGEGEYSSTPDSASLDVTTAATWELWCEPIFLSNERPLISKYGTTGEMSWELQVDVTSARLALLIAGADGNFRRTEWWSLNTQVTSMLSVTFDGGVVKLYQDAALLTFLGSAGAPAPTTLNTGTLPVIIGGRPVNGNVVRTFGGKFGSAKIYNVALTAAEVLTNYNTQKSIYGL
jgi:hypothetical protein